MVELTEKYIIRILTNLIKWKLICRIIKSDLVDDFIIFLFMILRYAYRSNIHNFHFVVPYGTSLSRDMRGQYPERTKMFVEKRTITYASYCVQTNQIYIIVIAEVLPYICTSPGKMCALRVVLSNEMYQDTVPGNTPITHTR